MFGILSHVTGTIWSYIMPSGGLKLMLKILCHKSLLKIGHMANWDSILERVDSVVSIVKFSQWEIICGNWSSVPTVSGTMAVMVTLAVSSLVNADFMTGPYQLPWEVVICNPKTGVPLVSCNAPLLDFNWVQKGLIVGIYRTLDNAVCSCLMQWEQLSQTSSQLSDLHSRWGCIGWISNERSSRCGCVAKGHHQSRGCPSDLQGKFYKTPRNIPSLFHCWRSHKLWTKPARWEESK